MIKDIYTASVSRLGYTDEAGYSKSGYSTINKTYSGHLKALTIKDGIDINNFGKEFQFNTDIGADILESDKLTIDGVSYDVKGVNEYRGVTFSRLMCILQKGSQ